MNRSELLDTWLQEEKTPFAGWDFSHLQGRMSEDEPPWSYDARAIELLQQATSVIDLDTGGGERLLSFRPNLPGRTVAAEAYPPNARLAHERLQPFDISVVLASSDEVAALPFADATFDLVLNRHGSFNAAELARIIAPGGAFLTKQIHGMWAHDLLAIFGVTPPWPEAAPEKYVPLLQAAGLTVTAVEDWRGKLRFTDVAAIVYYLKAVPWLVPGFTVNTSQDALFSLQNRLESGDELAFMAGTYLIEARK